MRKTMLALTAFLMVNATGTGFGATTIGKSGVKIKGAVLTEPIKPVKKITCLFDKKNAAVLLRIGSITNKLKLDIPEGVTLTDPLIISCQEERTIIVTKDLIIRTLGYGDMAEGREMLGVLKDGGFYVQNALIFLLEPIGNVHNARVDGAKIEVTVDTQKYEIDADQPHLGTKRIE